LKGGHDTLKQKDYESSSSGIPLMSVVLHVVGFGRPHWSSEVERNH